MRHSHRCRFAACDLAVRHQAIEPSSRSYVEDSPGAVCTLGVVHMLEVAPEKRFLGGGRRLHYRSALHVLYHS